MWLGTDCRTPELQMPSKRPPFGKQKAVKRTLKGRLLKAKRRPFVFS